MPKTFILGYHCFRQKSVLDCLEADIIYGIHSSFIIYGRGMWQGNME